MQANQGMTTGHRPTIVTILAALCILGGVLAILGGLLSSGVAGLDRAELDPNVAALATNMGIAAIVIGVVQLIVGLGLWNLQGWAWLVGVIVTFLQLGSSGYALLRQTSDWSHVSGIAVALVILWQLFRPEVRRAFGR